MDLTKYQKIEIVVQCLEALEMPVQEFEDDLRNFLWWESESNDRLLAHAVHEDVSLTRLGHSERGRACGLLFPVTGDEKHRETVAREIVHSNGGEYPAPGTSFSPVGCMHGPTISGTGFSKSTATVPRRTNRRLKRSRTRRKS